MTGKVSVVAHRGFSAAAPENTMSAFRLAADAGADLIELDVHLTADDQLVVIHDDTLDRTTDGSGLVRGRTYAEIQALDASAGMPGFRGERVPSLDAVLAWARTTKIGLALEIKQPGPHTGRPRYPGIAERVADALTAHAMVGRTLVHSFDHRTVQHMRELLPEVTTGILYGASTDPLHIALPPHASGIHPHWSWVRAEVCRAAHDAGMHVHAWGLPDPAPRDVIDALVRADVDSLDANDPRGLAATLSAIGARVAPLS